MRFIAALKILGILLMIYSLFMFPPIGVGLWYKDGGISEFVVGFGAAFIVGLCLYWMSHKHKYVLRARDGFLVVVLLWFVISIFASIPFIINLYPHVSVTDAIFESVSGLTTTGATVLTHLDSLPHAILYYRQQLHLVGGIGIVVLAVAVLPMLGIGGMQLYRAEITGPVKTTKLTPRITETAKALWYIYFGLAFLCALCYWLAGMPLFDAIGESFTTVSTGGFSLHDSSFAYYHSASIDSIAIVFMILGAINFSLHFQFIKQRRLKLYAKDPELRAYFGIIIIVTLITLATLFLNHYYHHIGQAVIDVLFTVVSLGSTTGLTVTDFSIWPSFLPFLIMFIALIGGCAGSTVGGLKIIRCLLLKEQGKRELQRLLHAKGVWAVKLGDALVPDYLLQAVTGFFAAFFAVYAVLILALLGCGLNFITAFGAVTACLSNTGASIGQVAYHYGQINVVGKWILIVAMLAGRLEIFSILILLMPSYWRA